MACIKRFYYVKSKDTQLVVTLNDFTLGYMPLIWSNGGLYGVIRKEKIENVVETLRAKEKSPGLDTKKNVGIFYWEEVEELGQNAGKLLTD